MTSEMYENLPEQPSLPYAGTSGWSGSEASHQRQEHRDSTGKTGKVQGVVIAFAWSRTDHGITIKELRDKFPDHHHGTLSGCLTALHKAGRLARLVDQRDHCSIYVLPQYVNGREAVAPSKKAKRSVIEVNGDYGCYALGADVFHDLERGADEVVVRWIQ